MRVTPFHRGQALKGLCPFIYTHSQILSIIEATITTSEAENNEVVPVETNAAGDQELPIEIEAVVN